MASRQPDVPAIEHSSSGLLGKMSLPIGMHRRAFSYDDALEDTAPMTPPPSDMCSNTLWRNPVIPERKYQKLSKVEDGDNGMPPPALPNTTSVEKAPVVKAKATSVIMNSLLTKHTQESIQRFEQQAGLRDAGYTPHKGLTAEETKYHRVAEALHKLKMQTGESNEEKQSSSAQSTPCSTPSSSPKQMRRSWFSQGSTTSLPAGEFQSSEMDKWSVFGPRTVQKSTTDPGNANMAESSSCLKWLARFLTNPYIPCITGGFTVQSYKGAQKPTPMELMRAQANRIADDPVTFKPPKMDMPQFSSENKKVSKGHNLKPRDMNILTPTGF
ncbi:putative monooxygenase p33MONOX isoform X1 [Leptodactylus fuscus]|uniref:putative monooxygenase p33MONOX isoform X1 n=1 Tax=Leptodactylus fuscus TaxID=238119 RepID=UPI003F4E9C73